MARTWEDNLNDARITEYEMTPRGEIRVGDRVLSSHYGVSTVTEVIKAGTHGQTTELRFASNSERIRNERYDSDSLIPKLPYRPEDYS
jgi:hypothetical protein